jgi:hypothetical protein
LYRFSGVFKLSVDVFQNRRCPDSLLIIKEASEVPMGWVGEDIAIQIKGSQATLVDLLLYEAAGKADTVDDEDVRPVCNYGDALIKRPL